MDTTPRFVVRYRTTITETRQGITRTRIEEWSPEKGLVVTEPDWHWNDNPPLL